MSGQVRRVWRQLGEVTVPRWRIMLLIPAAGAGVTAGLIACNVALGVLPVVFLVGTSMMLGALPPAAAAGVGSPEWDALVRLLLLACGAFAVHHALTPVQAALGDLMTRQVDGHIHRRLMRASLDPPGIAPLEDRALLDDLSEASRELDAGFQSPGSACAGLLNLLARYLQLTGCVVVVGVGFSWFAAAGIGTATLLFRYGQRGGLRRHAAIYPALAPIRRRSDYLREVATGSAAAMEIRTFGLVNWLRDRYRSTYLSWVMPTWASRRRIYLRPYLFITAAALAATAGTLGALAGRGAMSLTEVALILQAALAALRLGEFFPESDVQTQFGMNCYEALRRFERGVAVHDDARHGRTPAPADPPGEVPAPATELRFERVAFAYPGGHPVLDGLNLTIPIGKTTAIVGLNGAGKTTLIKLLTRLYEPTSGTIRADGVDLRELPVDGWRRRVAVIFQDFLRFAASARDNVAFGAVEHAADVTGVDAVTRAAGIGEVIDRLPQGGATPLSPHMAGGAGLSGGQWQRIAIARALFAIRHGASILVLDEPTASLDAAAEARFYAEFTQLTGNVTVVLISHRFATVRFADNIVVLQGGAVLEQGTHDELLGRQGSYAELFRLQAASFADTTAEVSG